MTIKQCLLLSAVAFTCVITTAATAGPIENYSPVTSSRLENPEPGNWMLYRRTYDGQGYSPLDQINTSNVKSLTPVWTFLQPYGIPTGKVNQVNLSPGSQTYLQIAWAPTWEQGYNLGDHGDVGCNFFVLNMAPDLARAYLPGLTHQG